MRSAHGWVLLFVLASINPVAAQEQEAPRVFFDGAGFVGVERTGHLRYETSIVSDRNASGTVGGGGFTVGTFLAPRVSLRLETAFVGSLDSSYSQVTSNFAFFSTGGLSQILTNRTEEEFSQRSAAVLVGYHTGRRHRVQLGFLGGVAFLWQRQHSIIEQTVPTFAPLLLLRTERTELTATTYRPATAVGIDADIALARRVSLVPQMRVQAVAGLLSLRPGIAVRWIP